jgi:hypothetical protein
MERRAVVRASRCKASRPSTRDTHAEQAALHDLAGGDLILEEADGAVGVEA